MSGKGKPKKSGNKRRWTAEEISNECSAMMNYIPDTYGYGELQNDLSKLTGYEQALNAMASGSDTDSAEVERTLKTVDVTRSCLETMILELILNTWHERNAPVQLALKSLDDEYRAYQTVEGNWYGYTDEALKEQYARLEEMSTHLSKMVNAKKSFGASDRRHAEITREYVEGSLTALHEYLPPDNNATDEGEAVTSQSAAGPSTALPGDGATDPDAVLQRAQEQLAQFRLWGRLS